MSKREYNGESIDVSWQTPPWQNDGETLNAYDSEGDGKIMTVDWPENATDPDELTDKQKSIILTAARYPSINESKKLHELSGVDGSPWYVNKTLKTHWNDRYWVDSLNSADPVEGCVEDDVEKIRRRLLDGASTREIADEYPANHHKISKIARGVGDELSGSDIPPLKYRRKSPRGWIVPDESHGETEDIDYDNEGEVLIPNIDTLREMALDGKTAVQIADTYGVDDKTIRRRLKGEIDGEEESDYPPLDYDIDNQRWYIPDGTEKEPATTDTTPKNDTPTTPTPDPSRDGTPGWVWAVVGAVAGWVVSKILR